MISFLGNNNANFFNKGFKQLSYRSIKVVIPMVILIFGVSRIWNWLKIIHKKSSINQLNLFKILLISFTFSVKYRHSYNIMPSTIKEKLIAKFLYDK